MNRQTLSIALLLTGLGLGTVSPSGAQEISARSLSLEVGGRLQTQIVHSSVGAGPGVQGVLRRARLTLDGTLNEWIGGRLSAELVGDLKDAYVRFNLGPGLAVSMGKFKRAFDLFELQSSSDINVERDGRVPGLDVCPGVGGICSWSRLTERLGFSDRDVGLRLEGSPGERWSYLATLTNGTGDSGDENDAKTGAGRVLLALTDEIRVGWNASLKDYRAGPGGPSEFAGAWGADVEMGGFETPGLHVQTAVAGGENWRNPDVGGEPSNFLAAQGIVSFYRATEAEGPVMGVEPLVRVSWADPDTDVADDVGLLITPGVWAHFGGRNKMGTTVDVYRQGDTGTEWSLKVFSHLYF